MDGRTDRRKDGRTSRNSPPVSTGHWPFGAAAKKGGEISPVLKHRTSAPSGLLPKKEEKIPLMCESIGHQPLWGHCLKGQTDRWMDIQIDKY